MTGGRASRLLARWTAPSASHPALRYSALRVALFVLVLLVLRLLVQVGALPLAGASGGLALLGLAVLISAPLSYLLFARQRDVLALAIRERFARISRNIDESARSEDDDAALLGTPGVLQEIRRAEAEIAAGGAIGAEELRRLMAERANRERTGE